jgi:hypothetical protein
MIYPNSISAALYTLLSSDATLINSGISVDLNEIYNLDPNRMPWVGIYNGDITIEPHRVQIVQPWIATYNQKIYVQAPQYTYDDGQNAFYELDKV